MSCCSLRICYSGIYTLIVFSKQLPWDLNCQIDYIYTVKSYYWTNGTIWWISSRIITPMLHLVFRWIVDCAWHLFRFISINNNTNSHHNNESEWPSRQIFIYSIKTVTWKFVAIKIFFIVTNQFTVITLTWVKINTQKDTFSSYICV